MPYTSLEAQIKLLQAMFEQLNLRTYLLLNHSEWTTDGIIIVATSFCLILLINYLSARKTARDLSQEYRELLQDFKRISEDLQNKSGQISSMSLQLLAIDSNIESFVKKISDSRNDVNRLKLETHHFCRELKHTKHSLESISLVFSNIQPDLMDNIELQYPQISKQDLKLLALLKMNMSNKEISNVMNVTTGAVSQSKRRLKKKLGLKPEDKLKEFLLTFEKFDPVDLQLSLN